MRGEQLLRRDVGVQDDRGLDVGLEPAQDVLHEGGLARADLAGQKDEAHVLRQAVGPKQRCDPRRFALSTRKPEGAFLSRGERGGLPVLRGARPAVRAVANYLVATDAVELARMEKLYERARVNRIDVERLTRSRAAGA